jgi:thiol-disulfide isomerase/thioredoxin
MIFGSARRKRQDEKKSSFDTAWGYTSVNEGGDSSYDQTTRWGITAGFMSSHRLTPKMSVSKVSAAQAKIWVKQVISDKIFNQADRITDQFIYNLIIDFGFNKPSICMEYLGIAIDKQDDFPAAKESLKIPDSWITEINRRISVGSASTLYASLWNQWWDYIINSGTFKKGAAGLAMRCWRYKDYGTVGARENKEAVKEALAQTTNDAVRTALTLYLYPPPKNKFYDEAVTNRKILFFTQKGCKPCLEIKPTCEALARQNNYVFQEVDIRTDAGKILMTEYRIGATPEVVLINGDTTVSFGAADLECGNLALHLTAKPAEPDPFDDGKPAPADTNWIVPVGAGALALWYFNKPKKRIGNAEDKKKGMIGGGLLLLLWLFSQNGSKDTKQVTDGGLSAKDIDDILAKSLENEGPWEAEDSHTQQDKGNYHRGKGAFLGTSWGITANFMEDWYGKTSFETDDIQNISYEDAKKIIVETVMTRVRISAINDKWIAAFFFDWMWQRPSTCLEYICKKAFKYSDADYQLVRKGYYSKSGIPDLLINSLNGEARQANFEALKSWRLNHLETSGAYSSEFKAGIRNRINSYVYGQWN